MGCLGDIARLDKELASRARVDAALRLHLGQVLEMLGRGAVFDLGFSSLGAYAVERCERSVRWAEGARCLARRLEALPDLRRAVAMGKVSWSMGDILARVATPADERRWLELAGCRTVRQVRVLVSEARAAVHGADACGTLAQVLAGGERVATAGPGGSQEVGDGGIGNLHSGGGDEVCTLTRTVDREEAWLFEATRCLLNHLGVRGAVAQSEALLAEAQGTLHSLLPDGAIDLDCAQGRDAAQQRWVEQLRRWRDEAEVLCEKSVLSELVAARSAGLDVPGIVGTVGVAASLGMAPLEQESAVALDRQVRALSQALAQHEIELSSLVLRFLRADGWRWLRYASEAQYARERLGLSRSSLLARRTLALRLERLPEIATALGRAQLGVEAALQLVRIATPATEVAWIERARRRTIKHLREEVAAALMAVRLSGENDCPPPTDAEMERFQTLEQAVVSGRFGQPGAANDDQGAGAAPGSSSSQRHLSESACEQRQAWWVMLGSLATWLEGALQKTAAPPRTVPTRRTPSVGRVTLRLRMTRDTYAWWRRLEAQARRWLLPGMSWLRFLCLSVWHAWRHLLGTGVAYHHIYVRDRFRCASPVCNRRDVTPHHLKFRSAGGSDEDENVASMCTWCHLYGVHGGRIRALGTAPHIHWELGTFASPCLIVHGRERREAGGSHC